MFINKKCQQTFEDMEIFHPSADISVLNPIYRMKYISLLLLLGATLCSSVSCSTTKTNAEQNISETTDQGLEIRMFVASEKRTGYGVEPQSCFLIKYKPEEKWQYFYSEIQGFQYEPGYEYQLLLQRTERKNPPQDASKYVYTLKKIISKTAGPSKALPENKN